jgi:hypothetical protein
MFQVSPDSSLRKQPMLLSERQIVLLDGIRYSADMASIALERLWKKLCYIDQNSETTTPFDIAEAALDAWSIVDASHRFVDTIENLPGLQNEPWRRILGERMADAMALRDSWQHLNTNAEAQRTVRRRGQAWGSLAWAQHQGGNPTGRWYLAVAGSEFKGSSWFFGGPAAPIPREDSRRIRLLHAERTFYLRRAVQDIFEAVGNLETAILEGRLRLVGDPVNQSRESDTVVWLGMTAIVAVKSDHQP